MRVGHGGENVLVPRGLLGSQFQGLLPYVGVLQAMVKGWGVNTRVDGTRPEFPAAHIRTITPYQNDP